MQEIRCPSCGKVFQVEESGYAAIVKQVRDREFAQEIRQRQQDFERDKENAIEITKKDIEKDYENRLHEKELQLEKLRNESAAKAQSSQRDFETALLKKDEELQKLKLQLEYESEAKRFAVSNAVSEKDKALAHKDQEIARLKTDIEVNQKDFEIRLRDRLGEKDREIIELTASLSQQKQEARDQLQSIQKTHEKELQYKDEQIAQLKDFRHKQSTKMIGEDLERYCETKFNELRSLAFRDSYFKKDNDAKSGSKGDYIYREFDQDGMEFISIMFEMKNETDSTSTKRKNLDFLKELDKDRNEKHCEYAVLVSMLEADDELYNTGIVDVSHIYPKMYIIRPQFFIQIISILRNAGLNSLEYRRELSNVKAQNIDISHFEDKLLDFQSKFNHNFRLASDRFNTAIEEIDKTIDHLNKIKENLRLSEKNLRLANAKAEALSIKELTKDNETMKKKFSELAAGKDETRD